MLLSDMTTTVVPRELAASPYERCGVTTQRASTRSRVARCVVSTDAVPCIGWRTATMVAPQDETGTGWMSTLEAAAAGIATADFGPANAILMGVSTARLHGAIPRALGSSSATPPASMPSG
jgi:hypothetical protein